MPAMAEQQKADLKQVKSMLSTLIAAEKDAQESAWPTLAASLPHAVADPQSQRHPMQEQLLAMLGTSLQETLKATGEEQAEMAAAVEAAQKEVEDGSSCAKKAEEEMNNLQKELDERQASSRSADEEAQAEEAERKELEAAKNSATKRKATCQQEYAQASSVASGPLALLSEGGWEDEETRAQCFAAVETLLKKAGAEPTLLAALPATFQQKPEKRGKFDKVIEAGAGEVAEARVATLKAALEESEVEFQETSAEALGLWAIADLAKEAAAKAQEEVAAASESLSQAKRRRTEADERVASLEQAAAEAKTRQAKFDTKARQLAETCESVERLRTWEPEAAPPPQPTASEGPVDVVASPAASPKAAQAARETAESPLAVGGA